MMNIIQFMLSHWVTFKEGLEEFGLNISRGKLKRKELLKKKPKRKENMEENLM